MNGHVRIPRRTKRRQNLLPAACVLALLSVIAASPAQAQNAAGGNHHPQASLHVQAQVVPVAFSPPASSRESSADRAIIFNLPSRRLEMTVTGEIRALPAAGKSATVEFAILQTLTIVPQ